MTRGQVMLAAMCLCYFWGMLSGSLWSGWQAWAAAALGALLIVWVARRWA